MTLGLVVGLSSALIRLHFAFASHLAPRAVPPRNDAYGNDVYSQPARRYAPVARTGPTLNGVAYGNSPYVETIDLNRPASPPPKR